MNWKEQDRWGLKEFLLMMLLEFVFVIGCIKFLVKPIYSSKETFLERSRNQIIIYEGLENYCLTNYYINGW